jgi:hypothetical protein
MKTDAELQYDVMNELDWEPIIKASEIGVAVKDGIVTLSGYVDSYVKNMLKNGLPSMPPREFLASGQWLRKSRSSCPVLLNVQTRTSLERWQMFWSGTYWCPMTA